ncbi:Ail/Lom family outer membrane beta-barrel protein [Pantoea sp. C2G6]|uniref:Ail/Lom family outer membrane beta-barrel protein n=1 Tax=Pantoea sp. C2G6 TaxID=3243084 RepID=UPI003EDB6B36
MIPLKSKLTALALLCGTLFAGHSALADNHTVSIGYAQSNVKNFSDIRGINLQYRYEWDSPLSVMASFSYMKGDDSFSRNYVEPEGVDEYRQKTDGKYYSLLAGPAYRINDYVSFYGLVGVARTKADTRSTYRTPYSYDSGTYNERKTSFAYGAGVVFNPTETLSVNVGYEGTRASFYKDVDINGFNIGVGYRF